MKKLVIIQTAVPDYRKKFFEYLYNSLPNKFESYGGEAYFEPSVKTDKSIVKKELKNYFLFHRKLLFQTGIWHLLFKDIVLVLELNPRVLSNWIFLWVRFIFKKETILWGHAWSRKGKKNDALRNFMRFFADKIIVYTHQQRKELQKKMPKKPVFAAPNAVLKEKEISVTTAVDCNYFIYVGRLTVAKKPFFLVKTFINYVKKSSNNLKLYVVGEGEERKKIEKYIKEQHAEKYVVITGHISNYHVLKEMYANSLFSVSPGYIGLSVTQSFGFGVPMLVSKTENHSPEIEAVIPQKNAVLFETDSETDFCNQIDKIIYEKKEWLVRRQEIAQFCKENYTVEVMSKTFINLVK